jgi:NAD(P)-dependent dehydrogenase (short-subunit alcohol dehydrogenase family)
MSTNGPNAVGHKNPVTAIVTGLVDMLSQEGKLSPLADDERIDGKTCLVTGANSGLGKAVAIDLARRGGRVLMACRGGHPEAGEDVRRESGSEQVEMLHVDLSDLESVHTLCDSLRTQGERLEVIVFNAGLMPVKARRSSQGFELMFSVHFLSTRLMVERMLADGVLVPDATAEHRPRVIFVASEAHKSSEPIDFDHFGEFVDYGLKDGMGEYGRTKLHMCTYATELSRQLNPGDETRVAVNVLCPGPVASNIAREAPAWLQPIVPPLLRLLFRSPEKAAEPVIVLACRPAFDGRTGVYLHMMREKSVSDLAADPDNGRLLWEKSGDLLKPHMR